MADSTRKPSYQNLRAWKEASDLVVLTYTTCAKHKRHLDQGLVDQIRRAAISIPLNLAEGNGRGTNKDALRFLYIARGSLHELEAQFEICRSMDFFSSTDAIRLLEQTSIVGRLIGGLIRYRKNRLEDETLSH